MVLGTHDHIVTNSAPACVCKVLLEHSHSAAYLGLISCFNGTGKQRPSETIWHEKLKKKKKKYLALCKKVCSLHLVFCSSSYTFTYSFFPASFILSAKCSRRINSFPSTSLKFIHSVPFVLLIILKFYNVYCFVSKLFNVLS